MAWGGKGGQVDTVKKKKKSLVEQASAKQKEAAEKAAWLKKTRNSPAAKAGFSDDERWALQKRHRAFQANRNKPKAKKAEPKKSETKKSGKVFGIDTKSGGLLGMANRALKKQRLKVAEEAKKNPNKRRRGSGARNRR